MTRGRRLLRCYWLGDDRGLGDRAAGAVSPAHRRPPAMLPARHDSTAPARRREWSVPARGSGSAGQPGSTASADVAPSSATVVSGAGRSSAGSAVAGPEGVGGETAASVRRMNRARTRHRYRRSHGRHRRHRHRWRRCRGGTVGGGSPPIAAESSSRPHRLGHVVPWRAESSRTVRALGLGFVDCRCRPVGRVGNARRRGTPGMSGASGSPGTSVVGSGASGCGVGMSGELGGSGIVRAAGTAEVVGSMSTDSRDLAGGSVTSDLRPRRRRPPWVRPAALGDVTDLDGLTASTAAAVGSGAAVAVPAGRRPMGSAPLWARWSPPWHEARIRSGNSRRATSAADLPTARRGSTVKVKDMIIVIR